MFPSYLIRDGPSNGIQEVSVKTRRKEGGRKGRWKEGKKKGKEGIFHTESWCLGDLVITPSPFPIPPCNSESLWKEGCEQYSIVEGTMGALCVAKGRYS